MNKFVRIALMVSVFFFVTRGSLLAATLQLNTVSGVSVGSGATSITTTDNTPSFVGKASAEATVDITLDDLTVAVLADSDGDWSYTPVSALSSASHTLKVASNLESLSYTLVVAASGSTSTASATPTTSAGIGGVSTSSTASTLPKTGAVENTFLMIAAGFFLMGLGVVTHQTLPLPEETPEETL